MQIIDNSEPASTSCTNGHTPRAARRLIAAHQRKKLKISRPPQKTGKGHAQSPKQKVANPIAPAPAPADKDADSTPVDEAAPIEDQRVRNLQTLGRLRAFLNMLQVNSLAQPSVLHTLRKLVLTQHEDLSGELPSMAVASNVRLGEAGGVGEVKPGGHKEDTLTLGSLSAQPTTTPGDVEHMGREALSKKGGELMSDAEEADLQANGWSEPDRMSKYAKDQLRIDTLGRLRRQEEDKLLGRVHQDPGAAVLKEWDTLNLFYERADLAAQRLLFEGLVWPALALQPTTIKSTDHVAAAAGAVDTFALDALCMPCTVPLDLDTARALRKLVGGSDESEDVVVSSWLVIHRHLRDPASGATVHALEPHRAAHLASVWLREDVVQATDDQEPVEPIVWEALLLDDRLQVHQTPFAGAPLEPLASHVLTDDAFTAVFSVIKSELESVLQPSAPQIKEPPVGGRWLDTARDYLGRVVGLFRSRSK